MPATLFPFGGEGRGSTSTAMIFAAERIDEPTQARARIPALLEERQAITRRCERAQRG